MEDRVEHNQQGFLSMATPTLLVSLLLPLSFFLPMQNEGKKEKTKAPPPQTPAPPQLNFQAGKVIVGNNLASIELPEGDRYLQEKDAKTVVEKMWGNPPNPSLLGLILPKGEDILSPSSWAIIVSFEEDGYVSDADAKDMDFDSFLSQMQEAEVGINERRKKLGYPSIHLVGWAEKPHYDPNTKKFFWAKNLSIEGESENTLNYNIRCLGRRGVLILNAVSSMNRLSDVAKGSKAILSRVTFTKGNRYSDYVSGDKMAAYGIGALIAGKLALKAGLFKILLKPLLVVGAVVIGLVLKMLGKKKAAPSAE
jgi:uncharacterized membrane-anchored protein